ncbi:hypothetical protein PMIN02_009312 [Paraphaeosphaeria minitans]
MINPLRPGRRTMPNPPRRSGIGILQEQRIQPIIRYRIIQPWSSTATRSYLGLRANNFLQHLSFDESVAVVLPNFLALRRWTPSNLYALRNDVYDRLQDITLFCVQKVRRVHTMLQPAATQEV